VLGDPTQFITPFLGGLEVLTCSRESLISRLVILALKLVLGVILCLNMDFIPTYTNIGGGEFHFRSGVTPINFTTMPTYVPGFTRISTLTWLNNDDGNFFGGPTIRERHVTDCPRDMLECKDYDLIMLPDVSQLSNMTKAEFFTIYGVPFYRIRMHFHKNNTVFNMTQLGTYVAVEWGCANRFVHLSGGWLAGNVGTRDWMTLSTSFKKSELIY